LPDSAARLRTPGTIDPAWNAWVWAAGAGISCLGLWLRLDQFASQTLLDDEWHAVHQLVQSSPARFVRSLGHDDFSIPLTLYDWVLAQTIGLSELGMRLPLMVAGVLTLVALPLSLRGRIDARALLLFALALALSPLLWTYARTARPYALTLLLSFAALACLDRGVQAGTIRWPASVAYAVLAALAVWLHAITAPFVLAPLVVLALASLGGRGPPRSSLLVLALLTGGLIALALLPPLLADPAALAGKAGRDSIRGSTLRGVWHVWLGTASVPVAVVGVALAALGAGTVLRASRVARWALAGLGFTLLAVLVLRPVWVFNPLTFGRYLLPALPLLLLCVAAGVVRGTDFALHRLTGQEPLGGVPRWAPLVCGLALAAAWWPTSPMPALLATPNTQTLHYFYQFDYRPRRNPVVQDFAAVPISDFWRRLAASPRGSVTIAVAPFRFESYDWLAPVWERTSGQRVMPGFLSGTCVPWLFGEAPPQPRFALRNAVHLGDAAALAAKGIGFVAYYRPARVMDSYAHKRPAPECEAWMRERFGHPSFEDESLVVWTLATPPAGPA